MNLILGLFLIAQPPLQAQLRQERLAEIQKIVPAITNAILQNRPADLFPLLSFDIIVDVDRMLKTVTVERDLSTRGPIYCRIFCADGKSVRDLLSRQGANLRPDIRFYVLEGFGKEDLEFAYIHYAPASPAWPVGIFVGLERIGGKWWISALFPRTY